MRKRVMAVVLACAVCLSVFALGMGSAVADDNSVRVVFDGTEMDFSGDLAPFTENDRTLVPFRKIFEALGMTVGWNEDTKTASGTKEGLTIELVIGSNIAKVNGEEVTLDVPAMQIQDRTVVPLRFVSEKSGATVEWDEATRTASITYDVQPEEPLWLSSDVMPIKDNRKAILTITTDDGLPNSLDMFVKMFEKYDLKGTSAMIVKSAEANHDAFLKLVETGRLEIQNHSMTHGVVGSADEAGMKHEIVDSGVRLRELFPGQEVLCFFEPGGGVPINDLSLPMVKENYIAMRTGGRGFNDVEGKIDWYNGINIQGLYGSGATEADNTSVEQMNAWLDTAIDNGRWFVQMWHGLAEGEPNSYRPVPVERADAHLAYVSEKQKSGELWVAFYSEAIKYIQEAQAAKLLDDEGTQTRKITLTTSGLDNEIFDYPLTVRSTVPSSWQNVTVTQGDTVSEVTAVEENGETVIYYDIVPNAGAATLTAK